MDAHVRILLRKQIDLEKELADKDAKLTCETNILKDKKEYLEIIYEQVKKELEDKKRNYSTLELEKRDLKDEIAILKADHIILEACAEQLKKDSDGTLKRIEYYRNEVSSLRTQNQELFFLCFFLSFHLNIDCFF